MPCAGLFTRGTDVANKSERSTPKYRCIQCLCQPTYTEQYELIHNIKHHLSLGFWITLIEDSCPLLYTAVWVWGILPEKILKITSQLAQKVHLQNYYSYHNPTIISLPMQVLYTTYLLLTLLYCSFMSFMQL